MTKVSSEIPAEKVSTSGEVAQWTKQRLAELKEKIPGAGNTFEFTMFFGGNQKLDQTVGLFDILPQEVEEIVVVDLEGNERRGKRREVNGRKGYFDEKNQYIPVHEGYGILAVIQRSEAEGIPKPEERKITQPETELISNHKGEIFSVNGVKCYLNAPDPETVPPGKRPRILVYYHGWNGSINSSANDALPIMQQVKTMRQNGDPVILVMPQADSATDQVGRRWDGFDDPKAFRLMIEATEERVGAVDEGISMTAFSGGWRGLAKSLKELREENDSLYSRIQKVALLDAAYGSLDEFAEYANRGGELHSIYTQHLKGKNDQLRDMIVNGTNVHIAPTADSRAHAEERKQFGVMA